MKYTIEITAFLSGMTVMVLELIGTRIIAPYLGSSIIIWTSLIGVIMFALSIGYSLGGRLADKNASFERLALILLAASFLITLITFLRPLLSLLRNFGSPITASLIATVVLFMPATIALGMTTPYLARLKIADLGSAGRAVGNLYAVSTAGSIIGTFLGGFFLISFLGNTMIVFLLAALLLLTALFVFATSSEERGRVVPLAALIVALTLTLSFFSRSWEIPGLVVDLDTKYRRLWIHDSISPGTGRVARYMQDNIYGIQSAVYMDNPTELVFEYLKMFDLAEVFKPDIKRALMIGAGAYTYPSYFVKKFPEATLDVVEIDPDLEGIAKKYLGFKDHPNLRLYAKDGRSFLSETDERYDVVYLDAFLSYLSIPFELTTQETAREIHGKLSADGVVLINLIGTLEGRGAGLIEAFASTYQSVFPSVAFVRVGEKSPEARQNVLLIASKREGAFSKIETKNTAYKTYLERLWIPKPTDTRPFFDEFAPVDLYAARMLF